jgi:hypothetical protein
MALSFVPDLHACICMCACNIASCNLQILHCWLPASGRRRSRLGSSLGKRDIGHST